MKAKKVFESLNFERGKDPKEALGLGVKERWKKEKSEASYGENLSGLYDPIMQAFWESKWDKSYANFEEYKGYIFHMSIKILIARENEIGEAIFSGRRKIILL